jgi:hypothetical protein
MWAYYIIIYISGFSDPYCMCGIVPGRLLNEDGSDQGVFSDEDEHQERKIILKFLMYKPHVYTSSQVIIYRLNVCIISKPIM